MRCARSLFFFFFNDTATTEIYTLSLHDALPILLPRPNPRPHRGKEVSLPRVNAFANQRSEEHTSELQSRLHLVCRLLLEKKKTTHPHLLHLHPQHPRPPRRAPRHADHAPPRPRR